MTEFSILRTFEGRQDYCQLTAGILHTTSVDLAKSYPHLVRRYKSRAAAKGVITWILKKYPSGREGTRKHFQIQEES